MSSCGDKLFLQKQQQQQSKKQEKKEPLEVTDQPSALARVGVMKDNEEAFAVTGSYLLPLI